MPLSSCRKIVSLSAMRHPIPQSEADKVVGLVYVLLWFLDQEASGTRDPGSDSHFGILKSMIILSTFLVESYCHLNASEIIMDLFCSDPNYSTHLPRYLHPVALRDIFIWSTIRHIDGVQTLAANLLKSRLKR
jgi:hypothetical protein